MSSEESCLTIFKVYQIGLGISYIHKMSIIHCDLKTANILISDSGQAVITDFGSVRVLESVDGRLISLGLGAGTLRW